MTDQWTTPWYPGDVKPVRWGVYERRTPVGIRYSLWDGEQWKYWHRTPMLALCCKTASNHQHDLAWRGLTRRAEE
jgi:putative component of toxin-antitoxin plasmid stabilization module